jgi:hypothetical protein
MQPTQQQLNCISAAKENNLLKIGAIAGAGKTSTLSMMAKEIKESSLYLAFNKVTALEAANKFPSHVTCRTTHSLAYAAFGSDLQHKLVRPQKYLNVAGTGAEIGKLLKLEAIDVGTEEKPHTITQAFLGLLVKRTVASFEQSDDEHIQFRHVPKHELKIRAEKHPKLNVQLTCEIILKAAKRLWEKRIDPDSHVLATHDTYLKLYQLSKPILPYKVLYLDEAQDTTDCVLDIVKNQFGKMKVVLVGDSRQAIYGWRGAINAMDKVKCAEMPLSKSFRYGQAVADVAMAVLDWKMDITGCDDITSVVGSDCVDVNAPYARLFRTNTELLTCAVSAIQSGKSVSIEIDVRDFVRLLQSAQALFEGDVKSVKHEKIVPYAEWAALAEDADHDQELKRLVAAVMSGQAPVWIDVLENHQEPHNPEVIFTTAHKSKGREFKQVKLEDDFPSNYGKGGKWVGLETEEQNLLYVACTRAINCLQYNQTVMEILEREKALRAA